MLLISHAFVFSGISLSIITTSLTLSHSIRIECDLLIERERIMLLNLKDIQEMTGYTHPMTAYLKLRSAGVAPFKYEKVDGRGAPVNWYREEDVLPVFADRLKKIRKKAS